MNFLSTSCCRCGTEKRSHDVNISRQVGFTLIELMVVITIIVILATISTMGYSKITKDAQTRAMQTKARQVRDLINQCFIENSASDCSSSEQINNVTAISTERQFGVSVTRDNKNLAYTITVSPMTSSKEVIKNVKHTGTVENDRLTWKPR